MTSMPIIDDRMVALLRRTGKRRASYRTGRSGGPASDGPRVALQRDAECTRVGAPCRCNPATGVCGTCDKSLNCIVDFNPGPDPFRL